MQDWKQVFLEYFRKGEPGLNNATYILNYPQVRQIQEGSDEDRRMVEGFCAAVTSDEVSNDLVMLILADLYGRISLGTYDRLTVVFAKLLYPCWQEHYSMLIGMLANLKARIPQTSTWQIVARELDAYKVREDTAPEFLEALALYGF